MHGQNTGEQAKPPRWSVRGSKSGSPSSHGAGEPGDNPQLLCAMGLSYLPSGMSTFGNGQRPDLLLEERASGAVSGAMPGTFLPALLWLQLRSPRISLLFSSPLSQHPSSRKPGAFSSVQLVLMCWQSCSLQGFPCFLILGVSSSDKAGDREM